MRSFGVDGVVSARRFWPKYAVLWSLFQRIEAEAAMLGQPVSMLIPEVVGFKMHGTLKEGVTVFGSNEGGVTAADGVALDLGVSSMQLDQAERGFSFQSDGPLDMRMSQEGESAADFVNEADEGRIADVLKTYGEEPRAKRVARAIVAARPITRTSELAHVVRRALGYKPHDKKDPATRTFQAIRIHINRELGELADATRDHDHEGVHDVALPQVRPDVADLAQRTARQARDAGAEREGVGVDAGGVDADTGGHAAVLRHAAHEEAEASPRDQRRDPREHQHRGEGVEPGGFIEGGGFLSRHAEAP